MLPRTLEPELMDTIEDANDYDAMDFTEVNARFVSDFLADWCSDVARPPNDDAAIDNMTVLDVGTGTAQIVVALCQRQRDVRVVAIDLAAAMLARGAENVTRAGVADRVELRLVDAKQLPFADATFRAVMSNSIVHHIPEPRHALSEMVRVTAPGGRLFVRDLLRPATDAEVEQLVALHTVGATPPQQQLFRQSLHAALTVDEVRDLIEPLGLPRECVRQTTDRHWTLSAVR
ncbi:MAG: class I SAM-dependent methyltransferase [Planctomycetaceae bacterium]